MGRSAKLRIRNLEISPPLVLAPMVGLSHSALRSLIVEFGGIGLFYTEMLSAQRLPQENEHKSPFLIRSRDEYPLFYQIYVHDASSIVPAVEKLHRIGAQGVDVNLGCPAPMLRKKGAGCALSNNHPEVTRVLSTLRKATDLPVSVKIRLGERSEDSDYLELCRIVEGEGGDCITVHARLNREKFCRKPRWDRVAEAKNCLKIPVIANGGIFTVQNARECLSVTGADGLMIGRGAAIRPWIFAEISDEIYGSRLRRKPVDLLATYRRFTQLLELRFSEERRLGRLKQFTHYFAGSYPFGHQLASTIQTSVSMNQAKERAEQFFTTNEPQII